MYKLAANIEYKIIIYKLEFQITEMSNQTYLSDNTTRI